MHILIQNNKNERLSPNFVSDEFKCKCGKCPSSFISEELIEELEYIRTYFNAPVKINSGYRCPQHNSAIGGASKSQHMFGRAADIDILGVSPDKVQEYLLNRHPDKFGIGSYKTFTHIDVRDNKARWRG
jgi:uncharacterized protein YcbK (DUF882 family)